MAVGGTRPTSTTGMRKALTAYLGRPVSLGEAAKAYRQLSEKNFLNASTRTNEAPRVVIEAADKNTANFRRLCKRAALEGLAEMKDMLDELAPAEFTPIQDLGNGTAVLHLSDLHFGEICHFQGEVTYDFERACRQLLFTFDQVLNHPLVKAYQVETLYVLLNGDIIDGEGIFSAQAYETDGNAYSQVTRTTTFIANALIGLADAGVFKNIVVPTSAGNHGRTTKHHHEMSNWDNVVYFGLACLLNDRKDVPVQVLLSESLHTNFTVRDRWVIHARHIGVKNDAASGAKSRIRNWAETFACDMITCGHWHEPFFSERHSVTYLSNGAFPPLNEYSRDHGFEDGRGQWLTIATDDKVAAVQCLIPVE